MASSLLFDLSEYDLTQVHLPPERVGKINPQAGAMRQLDHVIWMSDDGSSGIGVKHVREDEFWVPLHIPGRPLMPGVLIIEAAAQLSSIVHTIAAGYEGRFLGFTRCDDVAFRGQVLPGDTMYLLTREISSSRRRFITQTQAVVNDNLVYEGRITGMVM